ENFTSESDFLKNKVPLPPSTSPILTISKSKQFLIELFSWSTTYFLASDGFKSLSSLYELKYASSLL
ncbi:hypothetical protein, partial [Campylobacter concisus]|uniref:hypothetical protein n=1 Tax=Campylobacter concisus TaxID=199 RepID=UPI001CB7292C